MTETLSRSDEHPKAAAYNRPVRYPWVVYAEEPRRRMLGSYKSRAEAEQVASTLSAYTIRREG